MANEPSHALSTGASSSLKDAVIVGGGLSGTLAAILLGRAGFHVSLIDLHEIYPADFRAEQLVGSQVEKLRQMELLDILVQDMAPAGRAVATRAARTVNIVDAPHYGICYDSMVNRARRHLPPSVEFITGRVVDVDLTAERQRVVLSNGNLVEGRLVIVATGLGQRLFRQLKIDKATIRDAHSLVFGLDLDVPSPTMFWSTVLVAYGEQPAGAIDYLTIFGMENRLRANLFTYGNHRDAWTTRFVREPVETLRQALPCLEQMTGKILVNGPVRVRVNDLKVATDYRRAGIVLVGDAFQTSCPAAGTGIGRLLNDIDRLCNWYIPRWFTTKGMGEAKIGQFYDDLVKTHYDAEALRLADYRRSLTIGTGLRWKIHRRRVGFQNQLRLLAQQKMRLNPGTETIRTMVGMAPAALPPVGRG